MSVASVIIGVLGMIVVLLLLVATDFLDPSFGYEPSVECSHWPRDPVICDGIEVAIICRKCDKSVVNEAWVRGEL